MLRRGDERAVTVQIGAVLLLAIVFAALALYQVNAVPAENSAVEYEHTQQVQGELQDLRNAVRNVGTDGGTQSVSVTLGTSYPSRTFLTNPPDPRGSLETTGPANVSIDNATVVGSADDYEGDPSNLTGSHETTTLVFEPDYSERRDPPTTRIEHGFVYNEFDDATVAVTEQGLLNDGTIRLAVLDGNVSEAGRGVVTLDPTILSGPSDEVPITAADGVGNVTLTVPTASPDAWNETIGTSFDAGEPDARVVGAAGGAVRIELADRDEPYGLQVARVGIGDGGDPAEEFDVERADGGGDGGGSSPAYAVDWRDPSGQSGVDDENCHETDCTVTGSAVNLTMATNGTADGATVEYAVSNRSVGTVSPATGTTDGNGTNATTFSVNESAPDGATVTVYASSGSDGDAISLTVSRNESDGSGPTVDTFDPQPRPGGNVGIRYDWAVSAGDAELDTVVVELYDADGTFVAENRDAVGGTSASRNNEEFSGLTDGEEYTLELTVTDGSGATASETRTQAAG